MVHSIKTKTAKNTLSLPLSIISPVDIGRVERELWGIKNYVKQNKLKKEDFKLPKLSRLLDNLIDLNNVNLNNQLELSSLISQVNDIKVNSPVIHLSFSVDPSVLFLEKITAWFRKEINPILLLTIGLQPTIGAGLTVRTTNKYFDFSLRQRLANSTDYFVKVIQEQT